MDLIAALKSLFGSTATATRVPLLANNGENVGSDTIENVAEEMGATFRGRVGKSSTPALFKIWEATANTLAVLKIIGHRRTFNTFHGMVELQVGRYQSGSTTYDKTKVLSVHCVTSNFRLFKKIVGTTITYYAYIGANTYPDIHVAQIIGTGGKISLEVSNLDLASLTEIPLVV